MTTDVHDLAKKAQKLRSRIRTDEGRLSTAKPDQEQELQVDLDRERAQLAELEPEIEAAKQAEGERYLAALDSLFAARDRLLKLSGHFYDPGFKHVVFARCAQTQAKTMPFGGSRELRCDAQAAHEVREALARAVEVPRAPEPVISETQRIHNERRKNELAGRGYKTDAAIADYAQRGEAALHGAGWTPGPRLNQDLFLDDDE